MSDKDKILDYSKPAPHSGVADGFRIVGGTVCVFSFVAGLAIVYFGASFIRHGFTDSPTADRGYFLFQGGIICAVGLTVGGFSVRWFLNALKPKRSSVIPPSE